MDILQLRASTLPIGIGTEKFDSIFRCRVARMGKIIMYNDKNRFRHVFHSPVASSSTQLF